MQPITVSRLSPYLPVHVNTALYGSDHQRCGAKKFPIFEVFAAATGLTVLFCITCTNYMTCTSDGADKTVRMGDLVRLLTNEATGRSKKNVCTYFCDSVELSIITDQSPANLATHAKTIYGSTARLQHGQAQMRFHNQ